MSRKRTAILISGRGSNMEALIEAAHAPDFPAEIVLVISNRADAGGLAQAKAAGIADPGDPAQGPCPRGLRRADRRGTSRGSYRDRLRGGLHAHPTATASRAPGPGRLLNIHPSLLPAFKGVHVHEQALEAGVKISGCTVHFVVPELDSGPIIEQAAVPVLPDDTPETLAARILEQEHRIYPEALRLVAEGKVKLVDGKAVFGD